MAASNVDGLTLHSAFNFPFGNKYIDLNAKKRDSMREMMSDLTILIIDEISMVKAELLYHLHIRLFKEIKQTKESFGGVAVLLFGDIMQLEPVRATWIFKEPSCKTEPSALWRKFKFIELKTNHRQEDDKTYADMLNRIRFGHQTDDDIEVLNSRVFDTYPEDAIHIFGKNAPCNEFNNAKLDALPGQLETLIAINYNSQRNKPKFGPQAGAKLGFSSLGR